MATCELCNRDFKDNRALSGHTRIKHSQADLDSKDNDSVKAATRQDVRQATQDTRECLERHESALLSLDDGIGQLLERSPKAIDQEAMAKAVAKAVVAELNQSHPTGWCDEESCEECSDQRRAYNSEMLQRIEERAPGTTAALAHWERMNTPINVVP